MSTLYAEASVSAEVNRDRSTRDHKVSEDNSEILHRLFVC